jgi:hypothetical protein
LIFTAVVNTVPAAVGFWIHRERWKTVVAVYRTEIYWIESGRGCDFRGERRPTVGGLGNPYLHLAAAEEYFPGDVYLTFCSAGSPARLRFAWQD